MVKQLDLVCCMATVGAKEHTHKNNTRAPLSPPPPPPRAKLSHPALRPRHKPLPRQRFATISTPLSPSHAAHRHTTPPHRAFFSLISKFSYHYSDFHEDSKLSVLKRSTYITMQKYSKLLRVVKRTKSQTKQSFKRLRENTGNSTCQLL